MLIIQFSLQGRPSYWSYGLRLMRLIWTTHATVRTFGPLLRVHAQIMHRSCIDHALIMQVPSRLSNQMSHVTCTLAMDQSKPIAWSMVILSQSQTDMSEWYSYLDPSKYLETVWFNMNGSNLKCTYLAKVPRLTTVCAKWLQGLLVPS